MCPAMLHHSLPMTMAAISQLFPCPCEVSDMHILTSLLAHLRMLHTQDIFIAHKASRFTDYAHDSLTSSSTDLAAEIQCCKSGTCNNHDMAYQCR